VSAAHATPYDAEDDIRGRTYEVYLSGGRERALAAAAVDREFAMAMRTHHEGAVTMSRQIGLFWLRETGLTGTEHRLRFSKTPPPSGVDLSHERGPLSENDVKFVKAMTVYHQAAVDMARAYNRNPTADNPVIKAMNRDVIIDQNYGIAFLQRLISRYPVDPGMIHGMPGESAAMSPRSSGREAPHAGTH